MKLNRQRRNIGGRYVARSRGAFVRVGETLAVEKKVRPAARISRDLTREAAAAGRMAAQLA